MTEKTDIVAANMFDNLVAELTAIATKAEAGTDEGHVANKARALIVSLKADGFKNLVTTGDILKFCEDHK